jgi:hypothetical protein
MERIQLAATPERYRKQVKHLREESPTPVSSMGMVRNGASAVCLGVRRLCCAPVAATC